MIAPSITDYRKTLTGDEVRGFQSVYESFNYPERYLKPAQDVAEMFKLKTDRMFRSVNDAGFGIRDIIPEDVSTSLVTWDFILEKRAEGVERAVWFGDNEPGAPWMDRRDIRCVDPDNATEIWYVLILGFRDVPPSAGTVYNNVEMHDSVITGGINGYASSQRNGPVRGVFVELNGNYYGEQVLRSQISRNGVYWLPNPILLTHQRFAVGFTYDRGGMTYMEPVGLCYLTSMRMRHFPAVRPGPA
jgi:hypothetical protein